jgi:hypothetical protein
MTKVEHCRSPAWHSKPGLTFLTYKANFSLKNIPLCELQNPGVHTNRIKVGCLNSFYRKSLGNLTEGPPDYALWQPTLCCHSVLSQQIFKLALFGAQCAPCFSVPRTQHPSTVHSTYT